MKKPWVCPLCGKVLSQGIPRKYETLCEHVMNPNQEDFPERETWLCTNLSCIAGFKGFWDFYGDWYVLADHFYFPVPSLLVSPQQWDHNNYYPDGRFKDFINLHSHGFFSRKPITWTTKESVNE